MTTSTTTRPAGCLPAILILAAATIVALVMVPAAQTITARAETPRGLATAAPAVALSLPSLTPGPAPAILVATPTAGPDYAATAGYYAIEAAANETAGQANYATAAAIERNRQAGLSTATIGAATAEASYRATDQAAALTPTAAALAALQTTEAGGATRQALALTATAAPLGTIAAYEWELAEIERAREIERTRTRAWLRAWFWPFMWPALVASLALALAVLALRLVFQYDLVDGLLAIIERLTGKYPPTPGAQEPFSQEIAAVSLDPALETRLSGDEANVLRMLAAALAAEQNIERQRAAGKRVPAFALSRNQTEQHGYTGGGDGWTRARDWLMRAGLVIPVNGGQAHIPAAGRSVEQLYHLVVAMLASMTSPPHPGGNGAVPVPDMLAERPARDTGRGRGVE